MSLLSHPLLWSDFRCVCVASMLYVQLRVMFGHTEFVGRGEENLYMSYVYTNH